MAGSKNAIVGQPCAKHWAGNAHRIETCPLGTAAESMLVQGWKRRRLKT